MHLIDSAHTLPGVSLFKQQPEAAPHEPGGGFRHLTGTHSALHVQRGLEKTPLAKKKKKTYFALNYLQAILLGVPALRLLFGLTSHTEAQNKLQQLCTALTDFSQLAVQLIFFFFLCIEQEVEKRRNRHLEEMACAV